MLRLNQSKGMLMVCTECGVELWDSIEQRRGLCYGCYIDFEHDRCDPNADTDIMDAEGDEAN